MMHKHRIAQALAMLMVCAVVLSGCGCKHVWAEATCEVPKTCIECGETEGEAPGHTATAPVDEIDAYRLIESTTVYCETCSGILAREEKQITTMARGLHMLCSAEEYTARMADWLKKVSEETMTIELLEQEGLPVCYIRDLQGNTLGIIAFYDILGVAISYEEKDEQTSFGYVKAYVLNQGNAGQTMSRTAIAMVLAAEPKTDIVNAAALVTDLVTEETIIRDGMEYSMDLLSDPEGFTFLINPER